MIRTKIFFISKRKDILSSIMFFFHFQYRSLDAFDCKNYKSLTSNRHRKVKETYLSKIFKNCLCREKERLRNR